MIKRAFDLCLSILLLVPGMFICLTVSAVYLVVERANPFFRQTRVGKDEKEFTLYKIRNPAKAASAKNTLPTSVAARLMTLAPLRSGAQSAA